jgi:hypothetical protein
MKYFVWLMSAINLCIGLRCFLNAIHVLHTGKYSQTATVIYAILFLSLGAAGFISSSSKETQNLPCSSALAPGYWPLSSCSFP